jgi:hypothetical protein
MSIKDINELINAPIEAVFFYPFSIDEEGNSSPCDPDEVTPDGYCVYARHENVGDSFEVTEEQDFASRDEALAYAEALADTLGVEWVEYTG